MQVLNEDIKQGKFKKYYLLTGNDEFLINSFKKRLFRMISMENPLNQSRYEGEKADVDAFIDTANTLPVFGDARCILVEDSDWFKAGKGEDTVQEAQKDDSKTKRLLSKTARLSEAMDAFPDTTHIIFAERNVDKRSGLYKKVSKSGHVAILNHPTKEQLADWALRRLHQNQKKITTGNMNLFLEYVGDDMERVGNELDKLISYVADKEVIEQEDIERMTSVNVESRIFDMVEDIALGHVVQALGKYKNLADLKISPFLVMNLIARQFNQMMLAKSMFERNLSDEDMAKKLGLKPYVVGKLIRQGKGYSMERFREILNRVLDLEAGCKRGEMDADHACILLITGSDAVRR